MDDISRQYIVDQARKTFQYPADMTDEEVMGAGHQFHFDQMAKWTKEAQDAEDRDRAVHGQGSLAELSGQAGGPNPQNLKDNLMTATQGIAQGIHMVNGKLEGVPVIGPALKAVGDFGKATVDREKQATEDIGNAGYPISSALAKAGTAVSSLVIPQDALSAGLAVAPALGKGLGMAAEALEPAETGGALLGKTGTKNVAAAVKAMSGTPELNVRSALADPSMLVEKGTSEEAGKAINAFAAQPEFGGLKTGSDAREALKSVAGELSPRVSTGHAEANQIWKNVDLMEDRAQKLASLRDQYENADQIAQDVNDHIRNQYADLIRNMKPASREAHLLTDGPNPDLLGKNLLAQQGEAEAVHTGDSIRAMIQEQMDRLTPQVQQDLQKMVSARSVAQSMRQAPGLASPAEAIDAKLATQNMNRLDDVIGQGMDSLKPGSSAEYEKLVDAYHRAKVRESFEPLFAQNANGSPSVLRIMAALHGGMNDPVKGATMLASESPAVAARAIRTAAFLKDFGASLPSKVLGSAAGALPGSASSAGSAIGLENLFKKSDEKGK